MIDGFVRGAPARGALLGLLLAFAIAGSTVSAAAVPDAALAPRTGYAFALDTGELVYREVHEPRVADGRLVADAVTYESPGGEVFARKRVSFEAAPLAPAFRLEDTRTGYVEGLEHLDDGRIALLHSKRGEGRMRRTVLDPPADVVADAGFDLLIYRNLERLKAGATLRFPFAAPSQQGTVAFRLRRVAEREVLGEPAVIIRLEPDNPFIRWLADPIDVAYHADTGALLRYEGLSNIPDPASDENYRVRIDFPPAGVEPRPPDAD